MRKKFFDWFCANLLASLEDDLLQQVGELLHDGDRLAAGEADAVHGGGGVVGGGAEASGGHVAAGAEGVVVVVALVGLPLAWFRFALSWHYD